MASVGPLIGYTFLCVASTLRRECALLGFFWELYAMEVLFWSRYKLFLDFRAFCHLVLKSSCAFLSFTTSSKSTIAPRIPLSCMGPPQIEHFLDQILVSRKASWKLDNPLCKGCYILFWGLPRFFSQCLIPTPIPIWHRTWKYTHCFVWSGQSVWDVGRTPV
jgi:hypothetical protein